MKKLQLLSPNCFLPSLHAEGAYFRSAFSLSTLRGQKTFQSTFYPLSKLRGLSPVRFLSPLHTQGGASPVHLQSCPHAHALRSLSQATVTPLRGHAADPQLRYSVSHARTYRHALQFSESSESFQFKSKWFNSR